MMKYILISLFIILALPVYGDEQKPLPMTPVPSEDQKARWLRHQAITQAAQDAQKQRDADFEKHRLEVKVKEAADKAAGKP